MGIDVADTAFDSRTCLTAFPSQVLDVCVLWLIAKQFVTGTFHFVHLRVLQRRFHRKVGWLALFVGLLLRGRVNVLVQRAVNLLVRVQRVKQVLPNRRVSCQLIDLRMFNGADQRRWIDGVASRKVAVAIDVVLQF